MQLVDFQKCSRKMKIYNKINYENAAALITLDHHLITGSRFFTLDKLTSTEIHSLLILNIQSKPSFKIYFKNLFNDNDIDWIAIYMLPPLVTYNTYMRSFQCKILNNVLFCNDMLNFLE